MIKSMTGFGRGRFETDGIEIIIDIKSVNHKYHDINIKLPKSIIYLEDFIKKRVNESISRGKIDIFITYNNFRSENKEIRIDQELLRNYIHNIDSISTEFNLNKDVSIIDALKLPEVVTIIDRQDEEEMKNNLNIALNEALEHFIKMRITEGEKLAEDLYNRVDNIYNMVESISKLSTGLVEEYVVKLKERIKDILKENIIDENRLAMEAVIYADKTSIEEEVTRLKSHIMQFKSMINENKPIGKKLDFLVQEMNRETNTIASKANCLDITKQVIEIKNEIENIREQIQNIE